MRNNRFDQWQGQINELHNKFNALKVQYDNDFQTKDIQIQEL